MAAIPYPSKNIPTECPSFSCTECPVHWCEQNPAQDEEPEDDL